MRIIAMLYLCCLTCLALRVPPRKRAPLASLLVLRTEHVPAASEKQRLDVYLANIVSRSRSFMGDLCDQGLVTVNGKPESKSCKVCAGDVISFELKEKEASKVDPENIPLDILFEDDDIIVVNKPQGMVVHPAPGSPNNTFVNALLHHLGPAADRLLETKLMGTNCALLDDEDGSEDDDEEFSDLPETPEAAVASPVSLRPGVVHRLDKGTSGVLLAGKHPEAVAKLSALFAARQVTKMYLAVCVGHPGQATIVAPIGRSQKNRQLMTVYDGPPGKPAVSHVRTLAFDGKLSVALVRIETGRTHQIRVHLKERRTPIAGDEAYGNAEWNKRLGRGEAGGIHRPLLHAYETQLVHPFTGQLLTLRAPIPHDMADLVMKISVGSPILDETTRLFKDSPTAQVDEGQGFVPLERINLQESEWTDQDLPEDLQFGSSLAPGRKRRR